MRKSKFASICLYVPLITLLINIIAVIVWLKTSFINIEILSGMCKPIMLLCVATFIASIVSLIRVAISKKQLKGIAKSITGMALSIVMLVVAVIQGVFAEAVISTMV